MIFNILDNTTELQMTKYIIGEIFSSGGATLYKNHSDQTVTNADDVLWLPIFKKYCNFTLLCLWNPQMQFLHFWPVAIIRLRTAFTRKLELDVWIIAE